MSVLQFDPDALRRVRRERGFTQRRLANELGLNFTTVSMYEIGRSAPPVGRLATIARVLATPMESFIREVAK